MIAGALQKKKGYVLIFNFKIFLTFLREILLEAIFVHLAGTALLALAIHSPVLLVLFLSLKD